MSTYPLAQLSPQGITLDSPELRTIRSWDFGKDVFYRAQVPRLLEFDIPQLVQFDNCRVWSYHDPAAGKEIVGFGTLTMSDIYERYTAGRRHCYIPLLAVNPDFEGRGYGRAIVEHLIAQAATVLHVWPTQSLSEKLFLDVYTANGPACKLYCEKCQFVILNPDAPIPDPEENNEPYVIMARNIAISP